MLNTPLIQDDKQIQIAIVAIHLIIFEAQMCILLNHNTHVKGKFLSSVAVQTKPSTLAYIQSSTDMMR